MTKTAPQRRSRIAHVLSFFREGHPDEIRAVFHILMEEGLVPEPPKERKVRRARRRLNGAGVQSDTLTQEASA
jgi:pentatricopeptide repeat protein